MAENWRWQNEGTNTGADSARLAELVATSVDSSRKLVVAIEAVDAITASMLVREAAVDVMKLGWQLSGANEKALAESVLAAFQVAVDRVCVRLREGLN